MHTYRGKKLVDDILEGVIFCLDAEPIVPCEAVADDEAAEDVIRAEYANDAETETVSQLESGDSCYGPSLFGETEHLASDVADDRANHD
jgi:hypothetical protein